MGKSLWIALDSVLGVLFWALLGAFLCGFLGYYGGVAYGALADVSNIEGGYAYGVVFLIVPMAAAFGAVVGTVYGIVRWRRWRDRVRS